MAAVPAPCGGVNVTLNNFAGSTPIVVAIGLTDPNGAPVVAGNGLYSFVVPPQLDGRTLIAAWAAAVVGSSFGDVVVQLANPGDAYDFLSTPITVEVGETTSTTAAVQPVIDATVSRNVVQTGDVVRVDVDSAGTGTTGLQLVLSFA